MSDYTLHAIGACILCGNDYVVISDEGMCPRCAKVNP